MSKRGFRFSALTTALALLALSAQVSAATFQVDPTRSSISISGTLGGFAIQAQEPGSLQTRYGGTVNATVQNGTITFTGGSLVDAQTNGFWQPKPDGTTGREWADYGAQVNTGIGGTARGALRNIIMDVTSAAIPITNGSFDARGLVFSFPTNSTASLDFNAGFFGSGSEALGGSSTNRTATLGTITTNGTAQTLTVNVDATFVFTAISDNDSQVRFVGSVIATNLPAATAPSFFKTELIGNVLRLHAQVEPGQNVKLQSTANFNGWSDRVPETTVVDGNTRIFSVAATGSREFFRLATVP